MLLAQLAHRRDAVAGPVGAGLDLGLDRRRPPARRGCGRREALRSACAGLYAEQFARDWTSRDELFRSRIAGSVPADPAVARPYGRGMARSHQPRHAPHRPPPRAQAGRRALLVGPASTRPSWRGSPGDRRADAWRTQRAAGIDSIPSNDFSLYDQVLDTCCLVGAVPERFGWPGDRRRPRHLLRHGPGHRARRHGRPAARDDQVVRHQLPLPRARAGAGHRVPRWRPTKPVDELVEARALGIAHPAGAGRPGHVPAPGHRHRAGLRRRSTCSTGCCRSTGRCSPGWRRPARRGCSSTSRAWSPTSTTPRSMPCARPTGAGRRLGPARLLLTTYFGGLGDNPDLAAELPGRRPARRPGARLPGSWRP